MKHFIRNISKISAIMKARIPNYFIFTVVFTVVIFLLANCKKNTECEVVITAKKLSDTNIVVKNAHVYVGKYDVFHQGLSNDAGQFTCIFKSEAIMDVTASDSNEAPPLYGETTVRLKPGKTVYKSVFMD